MDQYPERTERAAGPGAIVTGAARGLGAAVARALAASGWRVALVGLEPDLLAELAGAIGPAAVAIPADVTDGAGLSRAFAAARSRLGRIDAVVANAGIANWDLVEAMPTAHFERVIATNLAGGFHTLRAALPHLAESRGYLLAVASLAAGAAPPGLAAYGASKAGLEALCDTFRAEVAHRGIAVGVGYFGWLDTDLLRGAEAHPAFAFLRTRLPAPLRRVLPAERAAEAILRGIRRRRRRVAAPGWIHAAMALRWGLAGSPALYRPLMPEIERLAAEGLGGRRGRGFLSAPATPPGTGRPA
jgi:NAD(P)-dependent dehydrogenase (short-subunit alcohol dehydrogenase family)